MSNYYEPCFNRIDFVVIPSCIELPYPFRGFVEKMGFFLMNLISSCPVVTLSLSFDANFFELGPILEKLYDTFYIWYIY